MNLQALGLLELTTTTSYQMQSARHRHPGWNYRGCATQITANQESADMCNDEVDRWWCDRCAHSWCQQLPSRAVGMLRLGNFKYSMRLVNTVDLWMAQPACMHGCSSPPSNNRRDPLSLLGKIAHELFKTVHEPVRKHNRISVTTLRRNKMAVMERLVCFGCEPCTWMQPDAMWLHTLIHGA